MAGPALDRVVSEEAYGAPLIPTVRAKPNACPNGQTAPKASPLPG